MQTSPTATVHATSAASTTTAGSHKDMKDVFIVGGLILFLAFVVAAFWYYSQTDEAAHSNRFSDAVDSAQVSQVFQTSVDNVSVSPSVPAVPVNGPTTTRSTDSLHDDIQFEIGRKGLSDDGKAALQRHAEFLKGEPDWGILLIGHTDQQGSMGFNKILGMKRADTVKQQLLTLGVPEGSIRTVSLGEEGALCIDTSDVCRRMNRRVHLDMRKIGREHLVIPPVTVHPTTHAFEPVIDQSTEAEAIGSTAEILPPANAESAETITERATDH